MKYMAHEPIPTVDVAVGNELTEEQRRQIEGEINALKQLLANTDYIICKLVEGDATEEEYAKTLANRKIWRQQVDTFLTQLGNEPSLYHV